MKSRIFYRFTKLFKKQRTDHLEKSIEAWGDLNKALNSVLGADAMLGILLFRCVIEYKREHL